MTATSLWLTLTSLLGARIDDVALLEFVAQLGGKPPKSTTDNDSTSYVTAKKQGLELAFSHVVRDRTRYPPRKEERRNVTYFTCAWVREAFPQALPAKLDWKLGREELERRHGAPVWTRFDDGVPTVERFLVESTDTWELTCEWSHGDAALRSIHVALREARELGPTNVATGMFAAWAALRMGLGARHANSPARDKLLARAITGGAFVREACDGRLWSDDLAEEAREFAYRYCKKVCSESPAWLEATGEKYGVGLRADFERTFAEGAPDFDLVPDTWPMWERLAPLIDARFADWKTTKFQSAPPKDLYARAHGAQLQARKAAGEVHVPPPATAASPAGLTERLIALIGKTTKDPAVVGLSKELGLRLPKKHEDIAGPTRGFCIDYDKDQKTFTVRGISFYTEGHHSIRFDGDLRFAAYAGPLPHGVVLDDSRDTLKKKLGEPETAHADSMDWRFPDEDRRLVVWFEGTKIRYVRWVNAAPLRAR